MKQILQNLRSGETEIADVPAPALPAGHLLIRTARTLVSAGTERMLVDFGKANLLSKARQQPERVKQVIAKALTDGVGPTIATVRNKLDQPLALGYCNVGRVVAVGKGVAGFAVGDRVASNGKHAEIVAVPVNLCAKVPDGVTDEAAAFTVLASIALQGIRLIAPTLGETIAVAGLGLIGLMTVQLLRANGCKVIGLDFEKARLDLARRFGATTVDLRAGANTVAAALAATQGAGVDGVIVTASTKSSEPIAQAAHMCRKRGRIVLVGVTGLELSRADFYEKELTFQVSCSYGPGRYDGNYELKGLDYPIGFVRWTEQRNFEAVLDMLARGALDVGALVTHRFAVGEAKRAYEVVGGSEPALGVVVEYADDGAPVARTVSVAAPAIIAAKGPGAVGVGVIGSGNYATGVLIPAFKDAGARLRGVASSAGVTGLHAARKFGFEQTTTDAMSLIEDASVDAVVITTRHDSHAGYVVKALKAGKHVFVEKPLALTDAEVGEIDAALQAAGAGGRQPLLMVGFNRRFAPHVVRARSLLAGHSGPKSMVMTVNAGAIPADHWTQDPDIGGGRIIGEACHFIDLLRHLAGGPIASHAMTTMDSPMGDTTTISLTFADGSIGAIHYFANGDKSFPKERLEIFAGGRILQLDNFRSLTGYGYSGFKTMKLWNQDKGQKACVAAFLDAIAKGGEPPIPHDQILEIARTTIGIAEGGRT